MRAVSLIVSPHSENTYCLLPGKHFVDQAIVNVDSPRVGACKVTDELLERRWILKRVTLKNGEQLFCLWLEPCGFDLLCVLERLFRVDDDPTHQRSSLALFASGSAIASRIDLPILGIESKCIVS